MSELYEWMISLCGALPGRAGRKVRGLIYPRFFGACGLGFYCGTHCRFQNPESISMGRRVAMNDSVWIAASPDPQGWIRIGDDVLIGPRTVIHSGNHVFDRVDVPIWQQGHRYAPVVIENDVWISAHCVVLAGVTLAKGTVVAAGAVVNKSTAPYSIVGGVPARPIGRRESSKGK